MMRSLFSGVSGLKTHQTKMDVIGNNISNVNTVAFKSSSTTFSDIMYQTTSQASGATATRGGTNAKQIGLGVTNGATKISITSAGAAQSTGDALDIRLTDTNTTNFFIVNNGSENMFTRAGSFYIDGNGNLAMTTTGYLVMGWQVDDDGNIVKDTVSALRVMQAANLTSAPEATTAATFSGVVDKEDSQFSTDSGYVRSVTFYDSLGYSYTAKFTLRLVNATDGEYTIELTDVLDSNGDSILDEYVDGGGSISDIFGTSSSTTYDTYEVSSDYTVSVGGDDVEDVTITYNGVTYTYNETYTDAVTGTTYSNVFVGDDGDDDTSASILTLAQVCGYTSTSPVDGITVTTDDDGNVSFAISTTKSALKFDTTDGTLTYAGADGSTTLTMYSSLLGPSDEGAAISNIVIDFSQLVNYDNGGNSTVVVNRGETDGTTGTGKKLGTMTGLSIQSNGEIYGSYSNGNTVCLGQIAVAQFANASGLEELGNNCYQTTLNSGDFDGIGVDISADGSSMNTGQLEMANVDLSSEFTDMITTQRGFQANSRIITVSDTMLEELINLKR